MTPAAVLTAWAVRAHERACDNARHAATELAQRRIERADVEAFLALRAAGPAVSSQAEQSADLGDRATIHAMA